MYYFKSILFFNHLLFRNQWAYHELLHTQWEGGRVQQNLPLFGQIAQKLLHHLYKVL